MISKDVFLKALKRSFEPHIYRRGVWYYDAGRVKRCDTHMKDGLIEIEGLVRGGRKYETRLTCDPGSDEIADMTCTCPYDDACKHAAALGLAYADTIDTMPAEAVKPAPASADVEQVKDALRALGIAADAVPSAIFETLLSHQRFTQAQPTAPSRVSAPPTHMMPAAPAPPRVFKPQDYFLRLQTYNRAISFHKKRAPSQNAGTKELLDHAELTGPERLALAFIKDQRFPGAERSTADMKRFLALLAEIDLPVRVGWDDTPLRVVANPPRLQAELIHEAREWPIYYDPEQIKHSFIFRMPDEYWQDGSRRHHYDPDPFIMFDQCVARRTGDTLELHPLPQELVSLVDRVHLQSDYESGSKRSENYQTVLQDVEVARFDELSRMVSEHFDLLSPMPVYTAETSAPPQASFAVDFDSTEHTLRVTPVIDYGCYRQDISESIFTSTAGGKRHLDRRQNIRYNGTHIIVVTDRLIRVAVIDKKKEIAFYKELADRMDELGFTKTLKCLRNSSTQVGEYLKTAWPQLAAFAESKGYPIIFTKDAIAISSATFRADFDAQLEADNDWLYFDVACYCDGEKITLDALREYLKSGAAFLRRADGTLVNIENREDLERLVRMLEHFEKSEQGFAGKLYHAPELEYIMSSSPHYNAARAKSFTAFMRDIQKGKPVERVRIPAGLAKTLRPYQKEGVHWLHFLRSYRFAGILADDMGLGKTLQTLTLLSMARVRATSGKGKRKPSLIVCPKTLLYNWAAEAEKFTPDLKVLVYEGSIAERKALRKRYKKYDVIVTSYPLFKRDEEFFTDQKTLFDYVVLDEAQNIKNHASKNAHIVKKVHADYRLALTGTPLENNVSELWSIFDFLMPGFFGSHEHFSKHFHKPIMEHGDTKALEHLRRKAEVFMLRRTKSEVLAELPPKIEQRQTCELGTDQNVLYQQILAKVRGDVFQAVERKGFKSAQIHILAGLTKLRQACNHPALLAKGKDWRAYESAKLDACLDLAEEIAAEGRKVLIFSQFTSMLDIVADALDERTIVHRYLSGKTRDRQKLVDSFNSDPSIPVFLISLKAGGTGLNLTAADTVIVFDPWWNPSAENQAVDRAHRIGQTKSVNVYRLVTRGTIEEKIQALQEKKKNLFDAVVGESKDLFKKLTWDDVRELFA